MNRESPQPTLDSKAFTQLGLFFDKMLLAQDLSSRLTWIENLLHWLNPTKDPGGVKALTFEQYLLTNPKLQDPFESLVLSVLEQTDALSLFTHIGFCREPNFISEAIERLFVKYLPQIRNDKDLSHFTTRILNHYNSSDFIDQLNENSIIKLKKMVFSVQSERVTHLKKHFDIVLLESLTLLSSQIETLGFSSEMRLRSQVGDLYDSAFYQLRALVFKAQEHIEVDPILENDGLDGISSGKTKDRNEEFLKQFQMSVQLCKTETANILKNLENEGVSLNLVFKLETVDHLLERILFISDLLFCEEKVKVQKWSVFIVELLRHIYKTTQFAELIKNNTHLLSRRIVERAGKSGEHYITQTKREYLMMLKSAAGGGFLTVWTTWFKFVTSHLHLAPFFEGLSFWLNYSGSFLTMYLLQFTLATKQPSMTAPALAAKLKEIKSRDQVQVFVDEVAKITRSQFIAAVGNLGAVIPGSLIFCFVIQNIFGHQIISEVYARKIIASLDPLKSLSIFYAIGTGFLLFLSSLISGWFENWFVYRKLPEMLSQSPAVMFLFGSRNSQHISHWLKQNISGVSGCISLGFLLAFVPIMGNFFGLPLDVRHVTLSTGSLTFALYTLPLDSIELAPIVLAILGIIIIGLCNFSISFIFALFVALRARQVHRTWIKQLTQAVWLRFLYRPLDFFFPIKIE
ncbi:MAG: site-specific recombinase [Bdellovibrionales bacterium]|nr:site-specific recombinase [Bdellovibrionales bacterium]